MGVFDSSLDTLVVILAMSLPKIPCLIRESLRESSLSSRGWGASVRVQGGPHSVAEDHAQAWVDWYGGMGIDEDEALVRVLERDHPEGWEEGFISPENVFLSREQSIARWRQEHGFKTKERGPKRSWADSTDLQEPKYLTNR